MKLGKLQEIDIRKVWTHEQYDFSKWLAGEENIQELACTYIDGLDFENQETDSNRPYFTTPYCKSKCNQNYTFCLRNLRLLFHSTMRVM